MAWFKLAVGEPFPALVALVIFTEVAAGVAVFAQALLRKADEEAANKAFKYSMWARGVLALTGLVLFLEVSTWHWPVRVDGVLQWQWPLFTPGAFSLASFFVYEAGNALMLLIEWMFAKILQHEDTYEVSQEAAELAAKLEKANEGLELHKGLAKESDELLEAVRAHLATHLEDGPLHQEPLPAQLQHVLDAFGEKRQELEDAAARSGEQAQLVPLLYHMVSHVHGGAPVSMEPKVEAMATLLEEHGPFVELLDELAKAQSVVQGMVGQAFTVRQNVQAFYCRSCYDYTEVGRGRPKVCKSCGTNQSE